MFTKCTLTFASKYQGQHATRLERERLWATSLRSSKSEDQHAAGIKKERLQATRSQTSELVDQYATRIERELSYFTLFQWIAHVDLNLACISIWW